MDRGCHLVVELHVSLKTENAYLDTEGSILFLWLKNTNCNQVFCNGLLFLVAHTDSLGAQTNIYNLQKFLHQLKCT